MLKLLLKLYAIGILTALGVAAAAQQPLQKAVSHNDYLQTHPLLDALEEGYVNIEVDIFLRQQDLIVAHWFPYGKGKSTLEKLYLLPLAQHIRELQVSGVAEQKSFMLLIDIKSSPEATYQALKKLLEKYRWMLSSYHDHVYVPGPVTIVLTGRKPDHLICRETDRLVMMDDLLNAPSRLAGANLYEMASCKYSSVSRSKKALTQPEKKKLRLLVDQAHSQGKKTRLWASPECDQIRKDLLECGIDLINTDHLGDLKRFIYQQVTPPSLLAKTSQP